MALGKREVQRERGLLVAATVALISLFGCDNSHVESNVPDADKFDSVLQSDINRQLTELFGPDLETRGRLLRATPSQIGLSSPKFYAWVDARFPTGRDVSGVVRLAAINKERFRLLNYMTVEQIEKATRAEIGRVFPKGLVEEILVLASRARKGK